LELDERIGFSANNWKALSECDYLSQTCPTRDEATK